MLEIHFTDLVHRFSKVPITELQLLTPINKLQSLIANCSQQPEYLKDTFYDPNDIYISGKKHYKNQKKHKEQFKDLNTGKKNEEKKDQKQTQEQNEQLQEKKKVYKPGTFALFYELNENKLDKDEKVWYYKDQKDIIGPASSYNMDKMAYFKNIDDETKVAYKSVDKFVKFSKIRKVVDANKKQSTEQPISSEQSH